MGLKLTPQLKSRIKALRNQGVAVDAIAEKLKGQIGRSRIYEYVREIEKGIPMPTGGKAGAGDGVPVPPTPLEPLPPLSPEATRPATLDEQRGILSALARQLTEDARRFRGLDDSRSMTAASRATALLGALRRLTPADRDDDGEVVRVRRADIDASCERAKSAMRTQLENELAARQGWVPCPHCGRPWHPAEPGEGAAGVSGGVEVAGDSGATVGQGGGNASS